MIFWPSTSFHETTRSSGAIPNGCTYSAHTIETTRRLKTAFEPPTTLKKSTRRLGGYTHWVHQKMHSNGNYFKIKISERLGLSSNYSKTDSRLEAKAQDARGLVGPGSLGPLIQGLNYSIRNVWSDYFKLVGYGTRRRSWLDKLVVCW